MKRLSMLVLLLLIAATHIQAQDATEPAPTVEFITATPAPEVTAVAPINSEPTISPTVIEAPAPDVTPEVVSLYDKLLTWAGVIIGALVALLGFTQYLNSGERKLTNASLAASFPPGVNNAIQMGAPLALAAADRTASKIDDAVLRNILAQVGYDVTKTESGYLVTVRTPPTPTEIDATLYSNPAA